MLYNCVNLFLLFGMFLVVVGDLNGVGCSRRVALRVVFHSLLSAIYVSRNLVQHVCIDVGAL